jgi:putative DNA primase/helicase
LLLVGSGANGKSTFLNTVRELLGQENTESKPLHKFGGRWATADLQGKIANIVDDLSEGSLSQSGVAVFKRLVGDDTVTAERKREDPFTFKPDAKHLYACNKVPDVSKLVTDTDTAFWRRWIIVEFPEYFPPQSRDPTLEDRLTTDESLSGILNWAIDGYTRLMNQGHFTNIETTADEMRRLWQSWGESVDEFIIECLTPDPDAENISTTAVNETYEQWCRREGKHAEPHRSTITRKIKNASDDFGYSQSVRVADKKNATNGYKSLGFTDEALSPPEWTDDESESDSDGHTESRATGLDSFGGEE